jgi:protein ImuA
MSAAPHASTRRDVLAEWAPDAGAAPWTFGDGALDLHLPGRALDAAALHELKPVSYADWPAALLAALRLAARRLASAPSTHDGVPRLLWCTTRARADDLGRLHAPGLADLGIPPTAVVEVEAQRPADVLWAMEEGLGVGALALVAGSVDGLDLTRSRRLGLKAAAGATPCLLVTAPASSGAPAAATRWRIARAPSAPHPFDPSAPGASRLVLTLERCRAGRSPIQDIPLTLEWCDAAYRCRVVAGLADRSTGAGAAGRRAG